ncbi:hypothetical protein GQ457_08G027490 [Hibiscus cannabinus]
MATTVYVHNLSEKIHWKGLWTAFGHHGDVIDAFIPKKRSKSGKRFGFVRYATKDDAFRAISRLNGFILFGSRILVNLARFRTRTYFWRKVEPSKCRPNQTSKKAPQRNESLEESTSRESTLGLEKKVIRVEGFVEEEALTKLKKCVVGTMATVCSIKSVEDRLQGCGFGELIIKSMGGRRFLVEFKDQELFDFLLEQKWSYLLEVFSEVEARLELFHLPERITWVQAEGIPMHCWNQTTFNRIAEIWGTFLALGENANQSLDGEKITLLISAKQRNNLDGVLELEAGREFYLVRVKELGFNIHLAAKPKEPAKNPVLEKGESSSDSSSVKYHRSSPTNCKSSTNDDSINAIRLGITKIEELDIPRQVGEDFISGNPNINLHKVACCIQKENLKVGVNTDDSGLTENPFDFKSPVLEKNLLSVRERANEDVFSMGFQKSELKGLYEKKEVQEEDFLSDQINSQDDWVERVDSLNSPEPKFEENEVPKIQNQSLTLTCRKNKKYGSLASFQDKAISSAERKRRDRALRRSKKRGIDCNFSDLDGRSLSDSDLRARRDVLIKEARKTMQVGMKSGIDFIGSKQDIIRDICSLEEPDFLALKD